MNKLYKKIEEILNNDQEAWQPDMIIERKEPFYWRISPRWIKEKTKQIVNLMESVKNK